MGCALGDSLGLPFEGASPQVIARLAPRLVQRFTPFGRGYVSDDTQHTRIVLQALMADSSATSVFERSLAWGLRRWFLQLPVGIGLGTARACIKLLLGFDAARSGVATAGNGPAMRTAILGAYCQDLDWIRRSVRTTTRITHTDPRAEQGALLVARMAAHCVGGVLTAVDVEQMREPGAVGDAVGTVLVGLKEGKTPRELVDPKGVSGFIVDTVPAVVAVVLTHPDDLQAAIECAIRLGGDTDTVAAIVGAVVGTRVGPAGLPRDWLEGFGDWPWSAEKLTALAVAASRREPPPSVWPTEMAKNLLSLPLAIGHLFWRYVH
jgi:ADP-ribosyl-[dinitrogen reductase] hydrolase